MLLRPVVAEIPARRHCHALLFQQLMAKAEAVITQLTAIRIEIESPLRRMRKLETQLLQLRIEIIPALAERISALLQN